MLNKKRLILISIFLIIALISTLFFIFKPFKNIDPSQNPDVLFIERYFKVELPQCKKVEILEGDSNSRNMTVKLTMEKSKAQQFLEGTNKINSEKVLKGENYQEYFSNLQKSTLSEFAKKDAIFFNKVVYGYYISAAYTLVGAYNKGVCFDSIVLCFITSETEDELIEKCGNEWYLWDNEIDTKR